MGDGIPMLLDQLLIATVLLLVAGAFGWVWLKLARRAARGLPLVEPATGLTIPLGLLDVAGAILLMLLLSGAVVNAVDSHYGVTPGTETEAGATGLSLVYWCTKTIALALASVATLIVAGLVIIVRYRLRIVDLGFDLSTLGKDLRLGCCAFLAIAPPVYGLQFMLTRWVKSEHPIINLLFEYQDPQLIAVSIFAAVIVAPVVEEFLFRGLLQGWIERMVTNRGDSFYILVGGNEPVRGGQVDAVEQEPSEGADKSRVSPEQRVFPAGPIRYLPIVASSVLFAGMHFSHGPDVIPLFVLALALGYLYQQTHRLTPCIVVHFLLNLVSMGMLLYSLWGVK